MFHETCFSLARRSMMQLIVPATLMMFLLLRGNISPKIQHLSFYLNKEMYN